MELTFLGTASAYPTPNRGVSCIVYRNEGTYWMFDCGEGSQIQLMKSNVRPGKISRIFITHLHGDHLFGLPGLLCTISQNFSPAGDSLVHIYGPEGLRKYLRVSLQLSRSQLGFSYAVHELSMRGRQLPELCHSWPVDVSSEAGLHPNEVQGSQIDPDSDHFWHICEDERHTVKAGWLKHSIPSVGYAIQEKPSPGKLDVSLLKSRGIPPGPVYAEIKGGKDVTLPNGKIMRASEFLGPERPGRKVIILGDTCDNSQMAPLCSNADVIVHEATLEDCMQEDALKKGHSTPKMAGEFAKEVKAKQLILTHFSQRYRPLEASKDSSIPVSETVQILVDQAICAYGCDNVTAAEDLLTFTIAAPKVP